VKLISGRLLHNLGANDARKIKPPITPCKPEARTSPKLSLSPALTVESGGGSKSYKFVLVILLFNFLLSFLVKENLCFLKVKANSVDAKQLILYAKKLVNLYAETVWANGSAGQGFYGLALAKNIKNARVTSSTGKKVEKKCAKSHNTLVTFETIAKAAQMEEMSAAKMSRSIKNKVVFKSTGESIYYCAS
jgi:hypothetical protein